MENERNVITIEAQIHAPIDKVWEFWSEPDHIVLWNNASDDWHTPKAENDLREGGQFNFRMESKDGANGFDFQGQYDDVVEKEKIKYTLGDGRKVEVSFREDGDHTLVKETFEPEETHSVDMQREGWQAILDNFKTYSERIHDMASHSGR